MNSEFITKNGYIKVISNDLIEFTNSDNKIEFVSKNSISTFDIKTIESSPADDSGYCVITGYVRFWGYKDILGKTFSFNSFCASTKLFS